MITPELISGVKQLLMTGKTAAEVKGELLRKGWSSQDTDDVFRRLGSVEVPSAPIVTPSESKKKHSIFWPVFISLLVVLAAAGGVWGYPNYWGVVERLSGEPELEPEAVFATALANARNVSSASYAGQIGINISSPELVTPVQLAVNYHGEGETGDWLQTSSTFDLTIQVDSLPEEIAGFLGANRQFNLSVRKIGSNLYFLLSGLPPTLQLFLPQLGDLDGRWLAFNVDQDKDQLTFNPDDLSTNPEGQELLQILRSKHPFTVVPVMEGEAINQADSSYQYELLTDKTKLRELFVALSESSIFKNQLETKDGIFSFPTDEDWPEHLAELDQIGWPRIIVWIDKEQKLIKRFNLTGNFNQPVADAMFSTAQISFEHEWLNFNQPVNVVAPVEAIPLEEILGDLFSGFSFGLPSNTGSSTLPIDLPNGLDGQDEF